MRFGELASRNGFPRGGSGTMGSEGCATCAAALQVCVGLSRYDDFFGTGGEATTSTPGREKQKKRRGVVEEEEGGGGSEAAEEEEGEDGGEFDAAAAEDGEDGEDGEVEEEVDLSKVGVDAFHAPCLAGFSASLLLC